MILRSTRASRAVLREPLKETIANDKGEDKGILIYKGKEQLRVECISAVRKSELLLVLFVDVRDRLIRGNFVFVDRREYAYKEVRGTNEIGKTFIIRNKIKIQE